ncbi:hypothetical protein HK102_003073, partial [Quaeritorhiza haematococci]
MNCLVRRHVAAFKSLSLASKVSKPPLILTPTTLAATAYGHRKFTSTRTNTWNNMAGNDDLVNQAKKKASYSAIDHHVNDTTKVLGIGSGSTVVFCVDRLRERVAAEGDKLNIVACVPTSFQARQLIIEAGLPLGDLNQYPEGSKVHGTVFIIMIGFVYYLQGFRNYVFGDAFDWYYRHGFSLDPGVVQSYKSTAKITWNIKMLYGLVFDNFPLLKRHHQPWLMISAIVSFIGFLGLGIPEMSKTPDSTLAFFWFALMGMAMADVITDAMVVKRARLAGQRGGANLQTFCWILLYVGSITGRPTSGTLTGKSGEGSRDLMKYVYTTSAGLLFLAAIFLTEKPGNVKWSVKRTIYQIWRLIKGVLLNTKVLFPISWIVFSNAIVPDVSSGMAYWKLDVIDIGADVQSYIDTAADLFAMFGLGIYAAYFTRVPFRTIFAVTQIISATLLISDNVLFYRWNTKIGIPDIVFML